MIETLLSKHGFLESKTNVHYLSVLRTMPQNEWFAPTNRDNEEFTICAWFASRGLICEKKIPKFLNGSYLGVKSLYFWNEEVDYKSHV